MAGSSRNQGFTLLELVVILVVIGVLAAVMIPTYFSLLKRARSVEAQAALDEIHGLENLYYKDHTVYSDQFSKIGFHPERELRYYQVRIELKRHGYLATAEGNLDRDPELDIWTIDEKGTLTHAASD